jgi:hypothetical protein
VRRDGSWEKLGGREEVGGWSGGNGGPPLHDGGVAPCRCEVQRWRGDGWWRSKLGLLLLEGLLLSGDKVGELWIWLLCLLIVGVVVQYVIVEDRG